MKWVANTSSNSKYFTIEETELQDIATGEKIKAYYLYVSENGINTQDHLQNTLEQTKGFALRKFQIPLDAWKEASD